MRLVITLIKPSEAEDLKKREKIQNHFWNGVGSVEHVSLPKLKDAVREEFRCKDERSIQAQIELMRAEGENQNRKQSQSLDQTTSRRPRLRPR
jgi:hypothetical protein